MAVRERANCLGNRIGAVIVRDGRIISTGYNGTPEDAKNCLEGGCHRCSNRDQYPSGTAYDLCICVHAEQNAILSAARFGIAIERSTLYTTMRPCFGCTKEMLQAVKGGETLDQRGGEKLDHSWMAGGVDLVDRQGGWSGSLRPGKPGHA